MTVLQPEEPAATGWELVTPAALSARVLGRADAAGHRPVVVAVDGRGGSGKSTTADRLAAETPGAVVVHTDDLAWWEPLFAWQHLLRDDVLAPLHAGRGVAFTPPEWTRRGRLGAIVVPEGTPLVVVEGVGASQRAVADLVDVAVWVQSDFALAEERGLARDIASGVNGDAAASRAQWDDWMSSELPFLADDRPWERADLVVAGNLGLDVPEGLVAVAPGPIR